MINFILKFFQPKLAVTVTPTRKDHYTKGWRDMEKYIFSHSPLKRYDVRETLRSGDTILHITDEGLQDCLEYIKSIYISSTPPVIELEEVVDTPF